MLDYEIFDSLRDNGDFYSYMVMVKYDIFDNRNLDYCL